MAATLGGSIAKRYARALFAIGVERQTFEALGLELEELATLFRSSSDLRQTLESPVFKASEKRAILDRLLPQVAPSVEVRRFALLLLERNRITALASIARAYRQLVDDKLGRVRAQVSSATALDGPTLSSIQRALERRTGKRVTIETTVDPDLIGGVVARVGDLILDGSLRTRLANLSTRILN